VKKVFRAVPILAALALFIGFMGVMQTGTVSAAVVGVIDFKVAATTTAESLTHSNIDRTIYVVLEDADVVAATTNVALKSTTDSTGIDLVLTKLTAGVYTSQLQTHSTTTSATTSPPTIKVSSGDTLTLSYTDASPAITTADTITIETGKPSITNLSPANSTITKATTQILSVDVKDSVSTVDKASINFLVETTLIPTVKIPPLSFVDIKEGTKTIGYTASRTLGLPEGVRYIGVEVTDKAGNTATFDADVDVVGNQGNKITVDSTAPAMSQAITGNWWDTTKKAVQGDTAGESDKRSSIEVVFTDALTKLDIASVATSDFAVAGNTVTAATVYTDRQLSVFLTLGNDELPGAKSVVSLIGDGVTDQAANAVTSKTVTPSDGIAPALTISSITPTLAGKDTKVAISITSDEALAAAPSVKVLNIEGSSTQVITATNTGTLTWSASTAKVNQTGGYNIYVSGSDANGNEGSVGVDANTNLKATKAKIFEGDIDLPNPIMTPLAAAKPETRDPFFITADFADEGSEYTNDSSKTVELTKFEVDGVDRLADVSSTDNIKFLLAISDIADGEVKVTVNAKDAAGSAMVADLSTTFTVVAKAAFKLNLSPGWNLVSLPADPTDTAINVVTVDNPEITAIITYAPSEPGGFLSAVRDADGDFAGTLTTIDSSRGYWMLTDAFKTLSVDLVSLAAGQAGVLPPAIAIVKGWNLVPVVDITGLLAAGANVKQSDYFASIKGSSTSPELTRAYHFDTVLNQWVNVDITDAAVNLSVGKGYWIYHTKGGVLVP
jgi:hypothetical protein